MISVTLARELVCWAQKSRWWTPASNRDSANLFNISRTFATNSTVNIADIRDKGSDEMARARTGHQFSNPRRTGQPQ